MPVNLIAVEMIAPQSGTGKQHYGYGVWLAKEEDAAHISLYNTFVIMKTPGCHLACGIFRILKQNPMKTILEEEGV